MKKIIVKILGREHLDQIVGLTQFLNPKVSISELNARQINMFDFDNYICFGLFENDTLIGLSGGWIMVRLYSGKQIELDSFIINPELQSKGYGKTFIREIELWAISKDCKTIELNTYVNNSRSHKFYFSEGFHIAGYHFQKQL